MGWDSLGVGLHVDTTAHFCTLNILLGRAEPKENVNSQLWRLFLLILWQKLFVECEEIGKLMYKYIRSQHGSVESGLNATDYVAGVQDIVDLGGKSYLMDFYLNIFSTEDNLTQSGMPFSCLFC